MGLSGFPLFPASDSGNYAPDPLMGLGSWYWNFQ